MTTPFNYAQFIIDYPEFAQYSDARLTKVFNYEATVVSQPISALWCDDDEQYYWICMVLAHIMYQEMTGITGRPSSVTQGSESASFDLNSPKWASYWDTTPYGRRIAQAIAMYLSGGHYVSNGEIPYNGQAMSGEWELGWTGY